MFTFWFKRVAEALDYEAFILEEKLADIQDAVVVARMLRVLARVLRRSVDADPRPKT